MRKLFVAAALLVVVAACSSGESPALEGPPSSPATPVPGVASFHAAAFSFTLDAGNDTAGYYFTPAKIEAVKGSTATITVRNVGTVKHNLTIVSAHIDTDVDPGHTAKVTVPLGSAASVPFYCKYHRASGMTGTFSLK